MEVLFWHHPHESIRVFRDMYAMSFGWGVCIVVPTIFYLSETWAMTGYCYDSLRLYHFIRLLVFILQAPLRFQMLMKLREAGRLGHRELTVAKLMELCRSRLWDIIQTTAYFVHGLFVTATVFVFYSRAECTREAPILYYLCVLNLAVFIFNMGVSYRWLTRILGPELEPLLEPPAIPPAESELEKYTTCKPYNKSERNGFELRCPICYEDYEEETILRILPCSHVFHRGCIDLWFQNKDNCPYCLHVITKPLRVRSPEKSKDEGQDDLKTKDLDTSQNLLNSSSSSSTSTSACPLS